MESGFSFDKALAVVKIVSPQAASVEHHGDVTFIVDKETVIDVLRELRDNDATLFDMLVDVTAIDWNTSPIRFEVVYFLASTKHGERLRVKAAVRDDNPHIPTAVEVWDSANWYERETYDMYGIIFDGHPDLRRFYMPEDFMDKNGIPLYPLRKDFPLMGVPGSLPLPPKD